LSCKKSSNDGRPEKCYVIQILSVRVRNLNKIRNIIIDIHPSTDEKAAEELYLHIMSLCNLLQGDEIFLTVVKVER